MQLAIRRFAILGLLAAFLAGTVAFGQVVVELGENEKIGRTRAATRGTAWAVSA